MPSVRTAALIAGVANALCICCIVIQFYPTLVARHDLGFLAGEIFVLLVTLPTVAMLIIIYASDATLILSRRRRPAAIILALFAGLPTIWQLYELTQIMRTDWLNIRASGGSSVAAQIASWLPHANVLDQSGSLLNVLAQQSIVFFLVVLVLREGQPVVEVRTSDVLHDVTMLASILGGLMVVIRIVGAVYTAFNYDYFHHFNPAFVGTEGHFRLRIISSFVSEIPKTIFPLAFALLILRSQPPAATEAPASAECIDVVQPE